jgi:uncharacterized protein
MTTPVKRPVGRPRKHPIVPKPRGDGLRIAASREMMQASGAKSYAFPIKPPELMPGIVPPGVVAPVIAADSPAYSSASASYAGGGFPGFPYLSQLATRAEYRAFAGALSTELTREWIKLTSKQDDATDTADKIKKIEAKFAELNLRNVVRQIAEHDALFGRGQLFIDIKGAERDLPLVLDPRTVKKGSLLRFVAVEPVWTTPSGYNSLDPITPDFYRPAKWFVLGKEIHATRLLTLVTRPLPDILKPAFNFAGMSLSQLAEPYVDNWLRTRQSVADLINNFSITALATSMDQVLAGEDDGATLVSRAQLFTATRSNRGLMLLDKEREEIVQTNTPLSGLHELQAQSQEQMCSVSHIPAIILIGVSPTGLNASSEGEIRAFYDWIAAQQEAHYRELIEIVLRVVQLSEFGEIDPDIGFDFVPLYQMTAAEEADIRLKDSQAATAYINASVIDPQEERERLARDPKSGYQGLDTSVQIVPPTPPGVGETDPLDTDPAGKAPPFAAKDGDWKEGDHPRAPDGKFGSGGGGPKANAPAGERARSPGLNDRERAIEDDFYARIDDAAQDMIDEYRAKYGRHLDPDNVKLLDRDFAENPDLAAAVHEPSSELTKLIFRHALEEKAATSDNSPTIFTAGGSGSGKSTTMPGALQQLGATPNDLIYDSVLSNVKSAKARIDMALDMTEGPVGIIYTNADVKQAMRQNALRTRSVSIDTLANAHAGASDAIRELAEHYKDKPRVRISVMNNQGALADVGPGTIADVPQYERQTLRRQLVAVADSMLASGDITQKKYDLLLK